MILTKTFRSLNRYQHQDLQKFLIAVFSDRCGAFNHIGHSWFCCRRYTSKLKLDQFALMNFIEYEPKPSGIVGILLQRTGPKHLPAVQTLLRECFFKDEPVVTALGGPIEEGFINDEAKLILEQISIVAIEERSNQIVAVAVNRTVLPQEMTDWPLEIDQIKCGSTKRLARFWYNISVVPNIFSTFSVPTYFEVTFLAARSSSRGKGLAGILMRESLQLAQQVDSPLAVIYCSNIASARIAERCGMFRIGGKRVEEYWVVEHRERLRGKLVPPNDEMRVYASRNLPSE